VAFQKLLGNKIKAKGVALKLITPHTDKVTRFLEHESDFNK
jgi:hypothetical protein